MQQYNNTTIQQYIQQKIIEPGLEFDVGPVLDLGWPWMGILVQLKIFS